MYKYEFNDTLLIRKEFEEDGVIGKSNKVTNQLF